MLNKEKIRTTIKKNQKKIRSYGVRRLGLFGSFVRGEETPASDVDLLVEFYPQEKNYNNFINLAFFFEDTFHRKVELVTQKSISRYIQPYIEKEIEYFDEIQ